MATLTREAREVLIQDTMDEGAEEALFDHPVPTTDQEFARLARLNAVQLHFEGRVSQLISRARVYNTLILAIQDEVEALEASLGITEGEVVEQ